MMYSVVIPVFNSELSLAMLFSGLKEVFASRGLTCEVIFVDDDSRDGSWQVIRKLREENPGIVKGVRLGRNFGQHNATLCGFGFARGERVITIDDDLQTPPEEIGKLIDCADLTGAELVYGYSGRKNHSVLRNMGSRSLKRSARIFHRSPGEGSSFRLMTAALMKKILPHQQNFIFLDEVLLWYTADIAFTEVAHIRRKFRQSGYSFPTLVRLFANIVLYYTMVPLNFLVYGGFLGSLILFFVGLWFIFKKMVYNVPLGYTSLIVTILFSTSIILFSLGVLGEYLSRIYQGQNQKPPYSVRTVLE